MKNCIAQERKHAEIAYRYIFRLKVESGRRELWYIHKKSTEQFRRR